ncbi:MAG: potassium channel family protein [Tepidiformaceae bacterium]
MIRLLAVPGVLMVLFTLWDAFETIVLPRRVSHRWRVSRAYYIVAWNVWSSAVQRIRRDEGRENFLAFFGPASLILLTGIWALFLITGFAIVHFAFGSNLITHTGTAGFGFDLYFSGTTFFTLGLGDVDPSGTAARVITILEAGTGFGFLALVIGYLPVLYSAFSRREVSISLLDSRAGSPPTAGAILSRYDPAHSLGDVNAFLMEWERWCAELLESHMSYPLLAYFRSQHDRQSWVAALTAILDTTALMVACLDDARGTQALLTFAMARHAAIDLEHIFGGPVTVSPIRMAWEDFPAVDALLQMWCAEDGDRHAALKRLKALRATYEPLVWRIGRRLVMPLPPWLPSPESEADWEAELAPT